MKIVARVLLAMISIIAAMGILFVYTIANSKDCGSFVIDSYEIHSGIDIPKVQPVNCYFDPASNVRVSVFRLKGRINLQKFNQVDSTKLGDALQSSFMLPDEERPAGSSLYVMSGERWGATWTYLLDRRSNKLWAELRD